MSLVLAPFLLACDPVVQDPLVSSPDKTLTDSVAVSAQVATGEQVAYTYTHKINTITEINLRRKEGSNPQLLVCDSANCLPSDVIPELVDFTDVNQIYDGTIKWYLPGPTVTPELYIYVGDEEGGESKYSITASVAATSTLGTLLSTEDEDTYGIINGIEEADFTLAITDTYSYEFLIDEKIGSITSLEVCTAVDCLPARIVVDLTNPNPKYLATTTGILYVFVKSDGANAIFTLKVTETAP